MHCSYNLLCLTAAGLMQGSQAERNLIWVMLGLSLKTASGLLLQWMSLSLLQNALPSDEDDKDPNDPYKALDIDLDK